MQIEQPFGGHQVALGPTRVIPGLLKEGPKMDENTIINLMFAFIDVNIELLPV